MNSHTLTLQHYHMYVSRTAAVLAMLCALSVFLYGIFLLMAVQHTAARASAERHTGAIVAGLGNMEMQYLSQQKALTPQYAASLGFVRPKDISTVYAAAEAQLTINANR